MLPWTVYSCRVLLPQNDAESASPIFCKPDSHHIQLRRERTGQNVRGGMKPQRRRDQKNERRSRLQWNAGKITVASDVALFEMTLDAKPIIRRLQWQTQKFRGF